MNGQGNTPPQKLVDFNGELKLLLDKYQYDLGCITFITQDGRIAARPEVFDRTPKVPEKPTEGVQLTPTGPAKDAPVDDSPKTPENGSTPLATDQVDPSTEQPVDKSAKN